MKKEDNTLITSKRKHKAIIIIYLNKNEKKRENNGKDYMISKQKQKIKDGSFTNTGNGRITLNKLKCKTNTI